MIRFARSRVVDVRLAVPVGDGVVQADDRQLPVHPLQGDLVVGPAHADRGAGPADPQGVVRAAHVQRLARAAVDVGGGAGTRS